jgi:Protein of unknown function (DUF4031)
MIYVDPLRFWNGRRKRYAHMISDVGLKELHWFANILGIKKHWFHKDHYDLREKEWILAINNDYDYMFVLDRPRVKLVSTRDLVKIRRASMRFDAARLCSSKSRIISS